MTAVVPSDPDRQLTISPALEERLNAAKLAWGLAWGRVSDSLKIATWVASDPLLHIRDNSDEWAAVVAAEKLTAREPQTQIIEYLAKSDGQKLSPTVQSDMGAAAAWWLDCQAIRIETAEAAAQATPKGSGYTTLADRWRLYQAAQSITATKTAGIRKAAASRKAGRSKEEISRGIDEKVAARKAAEAAAKAEKAEQPEQAEQPQQAADAADAETSEPEQPPQRNEKTDKLVKSLRLAIHAETGDGIGFVVHDQDTDTHAAALPGVWFRGNRTVNSVNSPTRLSTSMVPPCSWVTMS
jgi:hypothetical protein